MLDRLGIDDIDSLFDVPAGVRYEDSYGIDSRSERAVRETVTEMLARNGDLVEFLGRGHYDHYVPGVVDHLAARSEFLTSYTQYQPEVAQGFLQALFEYQSMLVELTGLNVANCSTYDAATALGEAATLAARARSIDGTRVLVPTLLAPGRRAVLENYVAGTELSVETYPMTDGNADRSALASEMAEDVAMLYVESPSVRGTVEEGLATLGEFAADHGALYVLGSDPVALSILQEPASLGVDVVVGDASTLGLGASYGMGLGMFAAAEDYLRQVPGRLVGAASDATGRRAYTLTLQTREQHIRRERATSNICTNQAWVALRTAMHLAWLGPDGLVELATDCITRARDLAERLDAIDGIRAPVHDRHHFREFVARTDRPAADLATALADRGFAVHTIDDHAIQVCVTETNASYVDGFVAACREVAG